MQTNPTPNQNQNQPPDQTNLIEKGLSKVDDFNSKVKSAIDILIVRTQQSSAEIAGLFGTTQQAVRGIREEIAVATPRIIELGGSTQDVLNIQRDIAQNLNTNVITLGETTSDLFTAAKAVGLSSENVGELVSGFRDAGIESAFIRDRIQDSVDIARAVGVNTGAVFKGVQSNLSKINEFGFQNGVQGLAKMSAQAAGLRISMDNVFRFADKVFDPEGATDMVAAFQRLGVAAGDLADPFRLMYLASEDVGELQNQVVQMTQKFTYFDEKSKEFKVFPNAKRDLRELATQMGISYDELVKMSIGQQKLNAIQKDFKFAGIDEESKQFIANVAYLNKEGAYEVKLETGETKLVSELSNEDVQKLTEEPATLEDIAKAQLTNSELQISALNSIAFKLGAVPAGARITGDLNEILRASVQGLSQEGLGLLPDVRTGIDRVNNVGDAAAVAITKLISGEGSLEDLGNIVGVTTKELGEGLSGLSKQISELDLGESISKYINENNKLFETLSAGTKKLTETALTTVTPVLSPEGAKPIINAPTTQQNLIVNPIQHQGTIKVEVTTPAGTTQTLTDSQVADLFKNEQFLKQLNKMISDSQVSGPYSSVPNKIGS